MPTAIDVLDRINAERRNKFAEETKPMREYISQMQAMKAQQRQRADAKEDYAWELDTRAQKTEEQRKAESQRLGRVATRYYAGQDFNSLVESGDASLEDLEKIREMGQDDVFKGALGELKNIQSTNPGQIATQLKDKYPDIDDARLNLLTESKLQQNYDKVYKSVIGAENSLESAKDAYIDGKINYNQYNKMIEDLGAVSATTTAMQPPEDAAGVMADTFESVITEPSFKEAVSKETDPNKKMQIAKTILAERGIDVKSYQDNNLEDIIGAWKFDDFTDFVTRQPETFMKTYIMGKDLVITDSERQQNWKLLSDSQMKKEGFTSIGSVEDAVTNKSTIDKIEKLRRKNRSRIDDVFKDYGLDKTKPIASQLIDMDLMPALLNSLDIEED